MKHSLPILFLVSFFLIFLPDALIAQNYLPFHSNWDYHFGFDAHKMYSLGFDSTGTEGADSVYYFNKVLRNTPLDTFPCSDPGPSAAYFIGQDNIFGSKMVLKPGGEYQFHTTSGDTFFIHTQAPIGSSWSFYSKSPITATLTGITLESLWGSMDSVQSISLSNGYALSISKTYGLVEAYSFLPQPQRSGEATYAYELWGIKGPAKGLQLPGFEEIYDYDPGDEFGRYSHNGGVITSYTSYSHDSIVSKSTSVDGDTLTYSAYHEIVNQSYDYGDSSASSSYGLTNLTYLRTGSGFLNVRSMEYAPSDSDYVGISSDYYLNLYAFIDTAKWDRIGYKVELPFILGGCETYFDYAIDNNFVAEYTAGLGKAHQTGPTFIGTSLERIDCYIKGAETWGTCVDVTSMLLDIGDEIQDDLKITYGPNPVTNTLNLEWTATSENIQDVMLTDLMGRELLHQTPARIGGSSKMGLDLSDLVPGIYQIQFLGSSGRKFTAKIVKQ